MILYSGTGTLEKCRRSVYLCKDGKTDARVYINSQVSLPVIYTTTAAPSAYSSTLSFLYKKIVYKKIEAQITIFLQNTIKKITK